MRAEALHPRAFSFGSAWAAGLEAGEVKEMRTNHSVQEGGGRPRCKGSSLGHQVPGHGSPRLPQASLPEREPPACAQTQRQRTTVGAYCQAQTALETSYKYNSGQFTLCAQFPETACFLQPETCSEAGGVNENGPGGVKFIFLSWYKN